MIISIITTDWAGDWYKKMVEGHLPPDFMSIERKGIWQISHKMGKGGVFLLNIFKMTHEKYIFYESSSSKEYFGIIFSLYREKFKKLKIFGPIFATLNKIFWYNL